MLRFLTGAGLCGLGLVHCFAGCLTISLYRCGPYMGCPSGSKGAEEMGESETSGKMVGSATSVEMGNSAGMVDSAANDRTASSIFDVNVSVPS